MWNITAQSFPTDVIFAITELSAKPVSNFTSATGEEAQLLHLTLFLAQLEV